MLKGQSHKKVVELSNGWVEKGQFHVPDTVFKIFWSPFSLLWLFKHPVLYCKTGPQFFKLCSVPLRIFRPEPRNYGAGSTLHLDTKPNATFFPYYEAERRIFFCITKQKALFAPNFVPERSAVIAAFLLRNHGAEHCTFSRIRSRFYYRVQGV